MSDYERAMIDEQHALATLDVHYGMLLGCPALDLRRPGWTILIARPEGDPSDMLFGQRTLVNIVAPVPDTTRGATPDASRAGVAVVTPELRAPLAALLRTLTPELLFAPRGRNLLDALVRREVRGEVTGADAAHLHLRYTFAGSFRPYLGQWLEWIEPLDEAREMEPVALGLLARFGRGVFVVRQGGEVVSYAGIRQHSPHVWEVGARTGIEALRGHELGRAVVSRATRAVLAEGRLPLTTHTASSHAAARVADVLGYRLYGDAIIYSNALPAGPSRDDLMSE